MYGNRLKDCREDLDLTQSGLGFMLGVSDSVVRSWENGNYTIPLPKLCKFCSKFNYSIDYLMGRKDSPKIVEKEEKVINQ